MAFGDQDVQIYGGHRGSFTAGAVHDSSTGEDSREGCPYSVKFVALDGLVQNSVDQFFVGPAFGLGFDA
jgi:hypothetical protein